MGITDGNVVGEVDCSVGTIVWVRRRNGSWWPGRILGPDELSASHLMSPRSGTPVKLLGREDASVDWYNLEKSKRVKAFRCGEFDDCIEKAERSQGAAIKKREKYARREDAILHALELEREQLEKKHQKLGIKVPPVLKRALGAPSGRVGHDHCKLVKPKSQSLSKGLDSSLEEESMENPLYALKAKHGKQSSWEEDNSEAIPRMRGLQDFGLRTASSKRKLSASVASEESRKPFSDDNAPGLPCGTQIMEGVNHVHNSRLPLAVGRKAQGGLIDESHIKKRDKRRPLVQVLQSAKFPVSNSGQSDGDVSLCVQDGKEQTGVICRAKRSQCVYLPADSNDSVDHTEFSSDQMQISPSQFGIDDYQPTSGSSTEDSTSSETLDEAESDSSERDYSDHETDEEMTVLSDSTQATTVAEPINSLRYVTNGHVQEQTESMSSEDLDDLAVGYMSHPHPHDRMASGAADVGVSKWQLKGKRNTRNLMKRPVTIGGKSSNGFIHGTYLEGKRTSLKRKSFGQRRYHGSDALNYDYDDDEFIEKNPGQTQMAGFGNRRYPTLKGALGRNNTDIIDSEEDPIWENEGLPQAPFRGYWDESAEYDPMYVGHRRGSGKKSVLVDVDLKARATYQGEHVPLVSLMSRLNGKAIIGHPIQIETLADGSSDALLSTNDDFIAEPMGNDGSTALTPVWRTARRTVMHRVPRPHPSSALNGDESGDPAQYSDYESKLPYQKSHVGHTNKARKITQVPEKKFSKKPIKKVSLSSQKTRMLSSIAIDQKPGGKACIQKFVNENSSLNGLIKPDNGPTTVTCIPVKLVFSRLLEAVGRPPSRPMIQCVSINGNSERKPS